MTGRASWLLVVGGWLCAAPWASGQDGAYDRRSDALPRFRAWSVAAPPQYGRPYYEEPGFETAPPPAPIWRSPQRAWRDESRTAVQRPLHVPPPPPPGHDHRHDRGTRYGSPIPHGDVQLGRPSSDPHGHHPLPTPAPLPVQVAPSPVIVPSGPASAETCQPGQILPGAVPLYPHVRVKNADEIPRHAVPAAIAVRDPLGGGVVFVPVYLPAGGRPSVDVEDGGAKIELDCGDYEVEIESRRGGITVEYDD